MELKKELLKKMLGKLKKKMDAVDCEDEGDVMEEHSAELALGNEEAEEQEAKEDPTSESELLAADEDEGEEELDRDALKEFMRGKKPEKKKGSRTVIVPEKSVAKSAVKAKFKKV